MKPNILVIHPRDNVAVALHALAALLGHGDKTGSQEIGLGPIGRIHPVPHGWGSKALLGSAEEFAGTGKSLVALIEGRAEATESMSLSLGVR